MEIEIIDVRGKKEYFAEVVNAYGQTVAKKYNR